MGLGAGANQAQSPLRRPRSRKERSSFSGRVAWPHCLTGPTADARGRGSALRGRVSSNMLLKRPDFRRPGPEKGSRGASQARCLGAGRGGLGLLKGRSAALETE